MFVQTTFFNYLFPKDLFKLQPERWKQQASLVKPTHLVRLPIVTGSRLLTMERLMSSFHVVLWLWVLEAHLPAQKVIKVFTVIF